MTRPNRTISTAKCDKHFSGWTPTVGLWTISKLAACLLLGRVLAGLPAAPRLLPAPVFALVNGLRTGDDTRRARRPQTRQHASSAAGSHPNRGDGQLVLALPNADENCINFDDEATDAGRFPEGR